MFNTKALRSRPGALDLRGAYQLSLPEKGNRYSFPSAFTDSKGKKRRKPPWEDETAPGDGG